MRTVLGKIPLSIPFDFSKLRLPISVVVQPNLATKIAFKTAISTLSCDSDPKIPSLLRKIQVREFYF